MDEDDIIEALEGAAPGSGGSALKSPMASKADIRLFARSIMRFLEDLDGDLTVQELREVLDGY